VAYPITSVGLIGNPAWLALDSDDMTYKTQKRQQKLDMIYW